MLKKIKEQNELLARPGQPLVDHLKGVARRAENFASSFHGEEEAWWAGLIHDLGKCRKEFQEYLHGERQGGSDTHHAPYGAALAFEKNWFASAFAIAGHHAGLHNLNDLQAMVDDPKYDTRTRLDPLVQWFTGVFGDLPDTPLLPRFVENQPLALELYTRMLYSCLVDADWLDAERHEAGKERQIIRLAEVIDSLIERVNQERQGKSREGNVNGLRHAIFDQCLEAAAGEQGFFSLTVPTGGGKTLSSMAFALAHAKAWGLHRIIVVIPYLSIIEQNAAEYRRILDPDELGLVVEHHSSVPERETGGNETVATLSQAADNWDAPIIITTSVQFIESLFASSPARCRKLHNIANSVVIFDEVQTLPTHLLNPLLNVMKELRRNYGVSFLFMTATQPAFSVGPSLSEGFAPDEVREITRDTPQLFAVLQRVEYHSPLTIEWQTLANRLAACPQVLCVVNVRKHAYRLWEKLRDVLPPEERNSVFHLSSSMCAEHRLWILGDSREPQPCSIRHRLRHNLPCRLVATQVVEAGVDIDFPVVYRALGPLDAIVQAAGRCNREGRLQDAEGRPLHGQVYLFIPEEKGLPPGVYTTATSISAGMLGGCLESLGRDPAIFGRYFSQLFDLTNTDHARRGESSIQEDRENFRFREVSSKAKVIFDDSRPVVVPFQHGAAIIDSIQNRERLSGQPRFNRYDLRRLQRYMVNVRSQDFTRLREASMVKPLLPNLDLYVLKEGCYHSHLGLIIDNHPLEDFIQ
ncbi:MAG: CRISPR-associated helicase Cas3' [Dissulfurimicrobium sp.]|uniref:CRISPR-associated helicase Cas3' n=2 Tax=Dissulfurimicrobium sp. TaxID=2022436 RepID=UPI0040493E42